MAKPPKLYPNLPRDPAFPKGRRVDAILVNIGVRVPDIRWADNLYKPFKVYTPNLINVSTNAAAYLNTKSGTKNPNWRVTIAKGGDATSGYVREHYHVKPTKYLVTSENSNNLSHGSGVVFGGVTNAPNSTVSIDARALASLKHRLQSKVGNAQLAPPLAESREIHRLVRQINGLGMDALRALLAAKHSRGKSITKLIGNIWLGYGFGVNPLLHDIQSAADSILHYVTRQDSRVRLSGSATQEYHSGSIDTASSNYIAQDCAFGWYRSVVHSQGIRYRAAVDLQVRGSANYGVLDHLGLKIEQVPSALWELTAFSWVVDYFVTVGPWLDDMFYTIPGVVKYLSKNYRYQSVTTSNLKPFPTAGTTVSLTGPASIGQYTTFSREKLAPVFPALPLRIKSADEVASYGLNKMMNLASVLAGRRGPKL